MRSRPVVLAVLLASSTTLAAQECVGIPKGGKGFLAVGPTGADGSGGNGLAFAYQGSNRSLLATAQSLNVFAHASPQRIRSAEGIFRLKGRCVTAGLNWQTWDTEGRESTGWSINEPDVIVERHSIGGDYHRLRIPIDMSFGRTIGVKRTSFVPYINPYAVFETEHLQPHELTGTAPSQSRNSLGWGVETGFAFRAGWFIARPMLNVTHTRDRALSGHNNWADLAMHFGVVF